jgi:hypothetical protein
VGRCARAFRRGARPYNRAALAPFPRHAALARLDGVALTYCRCIRDELLAQGDGAASRAERSRVRAAAKQDAEEPDRPAAAALAEQRTKPGARARCQACESTPGRCGRGSATRAAHAAQPCATLSRACSSPSASTVMDQIGHTDPTFTLRVYRHAMPRDARSKRALRELVGLADQPSDWAATAFQSHLQPSRRLPGVEPNAGN